MPTIGANGTPFRGAADVAFRPREFTGTITDGWTTVPYCTTDFAPYGNTAADHLNQIHTPANIARGIGDICRYMGVVDGTCWRMPTQSEWNELYGSTEQDKGQSVNRYRRLERTNKYKNATFVAWMQEIDLSA